MLRLLRVPEMSISIDVPKEVEEQLLARWGDLPQAAKEALAIESYRTRKISVGFTCEDKLGMGVVEAEEWLGQRNVPLNYTESDLGVADSQTLERLMGSGLDLDETAKANLCCTSHDLRNR